MINNEVLGAGLLASGYLLRSVQLAWPRWKKILIRKHRMHKAAQEERKILKTYGRKEDDHELSPSHR